MMCFGADNLKSKLLSQYFSTILIIASCVFFVNSHGVAGPIFKSVGDLKLSKIKKFKVPIVRVSVPVQIMNLPEPWQNGDLVVDASVYFFKGSDFQTGVVGYSAGRTIKHQTFKNGSTQGMVYVFLDEVHGATTGQYVTLSIAFAKFGDQLKILGVGWNFPSGSGGMPVDFLDFKEGVIDSIIPWQESPFIL